MREGPARVPHAVVRARVRRALARAPPPARYPFPSPSLSLRHTRLHRRAQQHQTTPRAAPRNASRRPYHQATAARAPRPSQHDARASIHSLARERVGAQGHGCGWVMSCPSTIPSRDFRRTSREGSTCWRLRRFRSDKRAGGTCSHHHPAPAGRRE